MNTKINFNLSILTLIILLTACSNNRKLLNEENPFYKKGMELRQKGQYQDAESAFSKCLQFSPKSYKSNLQLALLYEDHFQDYPQAIVHYKTFIRNSNNGSDIKIVKKWLGRAEKKYFESLLPKYGMLEKQKKEVTANKLQETSLILNTEPQKKFEDPANEIREILIATDQQALEHMKTQSKPKKLEGSQPWQENNPNVYIVQEGDTLVRIAKKVFGNQSYWEQIFEENRDTIQSPELLQIGQRLRIPDSTYKTSK